MAELAGRWNPDNFIDIAGIPVPGLQVTVRLPGTTTPAVLYTNRFKAAFAPNPVTADSLGNLAFYADPGHYDLYIPGPPAATLSDVVVHPDPSFQLSSVEIDLGKEFGVVCDGSTLNDSQLAAAMAGTSNGDTLVFPPGICLVSLEFLYRAFRRYLGYGCTIRQADDANLLGLMVAEDWYNNSTVTGAPVWIEGLTFDGNAANNSSPTHCLVVMNWRSKIYHNTGQNCDGDPLHMTAHSRSGALITSTMVENEIKDFRTIDPIGGIGVHIVDSSHQKITDGQLHHCPALNGGVNAINTDTPAGWDFGEFHAYYQQQSSVVGAFGHSTSVHDAQLESWGEEGNASSYYPAMSFGLIGATGDVPFFDGATTNASTNFTSAAASFGAADVGKVIAAIGVPTGATISSVTNPTTVVLSAAATATAAGLAFTIKDRAVPGPLSHFSDIRMWRERDIPGHFHGLDLTAQTNSVVEAVAADNSYFGRGTTDDVGFVFDAQSGGELTVHGHNNIAVRTPLANRILKGNNVEYRDPGFVDEKIVTGNYTLVRSDAGRILSQATNDGTTKTITIPTHAAVPFSVNTRIRIYLAGWCILNVTPTSPALLVTPQSGSAPVAASFGTRALNSQGMLVELWQRSINEWVMTGDFL